jgi:hypothetical protein
MQQENDEMTMMGVRGKAVQVWLVADGRSDVSFRSVQSVRRLPYNGRGVEILTVLSQTT